MGLAYSDDIGHALDPGRQAEPEVSENVKRRAYLAAVSGLLFGETYLGGAILGEAAPLAWERLVEVTSTPLPTKIGPSDVAALRVVTEEMRALGRSGHAGMPDVLTPVTRRADRLLDRAEGSQTTMKALRSAMAALHELAGWCAYDMQLFDLARWHCDRAMRLARDAGDLPAMASAVLHAGWGETGHDDALKLCQLALIRLGDAEPGLRRELHVESAWRYAQIDRADQADRELAVTRELTPPTDLFEVADLDLGLGSVELSLGRLNTANHYITTAVRTFSEQDRRDCALARTHLATAHAIAGEPDTERLVRQVIEVMTGLPSVRGRAKLEPLEQALAARKTSTFTDMAQRIRRVRLG